MYLKIMMLSWEYPPKSVGGLAQHVYDLTASLADLGQEVDLVTTGEPGLPGVEKVKGIRVHRVIPYNLTPPHFISSIIQLNLSMLEKAVALFNAGDDYHMVHAHDWLVAYAGRALKHIYKVPLVATIHATEHGRNHGLHNQDQRYISDVEWWLAYEAWKVVCCSSYMKKELINVFGIPEDKVCPIYNGVSVDSLTCRLPGEVIGSFREQYARPEEKIVFFVGRLVQEKGLQVLLEAAPKILEGHPRTRFVIAGKGPVREAMEEKVREMEMGDRVAFTGYVDNETRNLLYASADVAVFPSLYEPFGIVALEGMATRTPVIVSDTGGLSEIVDHGIDGLKFPPGSPGSLAESVLQILKDDTTARRLAKKAFQKVVYDYSWEGIARKTVEVYQEVYTSFLKSPWHTRTFALPRRPGEEYVKENSTSLVT